VAQARARGLSVGLVPTMGALHAGHASLMEAARKETGFVVVTIFLNPMQFGPQEDLARYPRCLEDDLRLCASQGVDLVFHPEAETIYPPGSRTVVEVQGWQDLLCGASRPGHFRGVATVVAKLFQIIPADVAFFGQKDAQQARIIQQMVSDLNFPIQIRVCPTVREADGLALSSRNRYLDPNQRRQAPVLFKALQEVQMLVAAGERDTSALRKALTERLASAPDARLDYAAFVDFATLQPLERMRGKLLAALAVWFGTTRLIDNVLLDAGTPDSDEADPDQGLSRGFSGGSLSSSPERS
jgi:pantoate--beta-alanine ligase